MLSLFYNKVCQNMLHRKGYQIFGLVTIDPKSFPPDAFFSCLTKKNYYARNEGSYIAWLTKTIDESNDCWLVNISVFYHNTIQ